MKLVNDHIQNPVTIDLDEINNLHEIPGNNYENKMYLLNQPKGFRTVLDF